MGVYDGITGVVTQPIQGAKKDGLSGFTKGVGMGIMGLLVKPSAGKFATQHERLHQPDWRQRVMRSRRTPSRASTGKSRSDTARR